MQPETASYQHHHQISIFTACLPNHLYGKPFAMLSGMINPQRQRARQSERFKLETGLPRACFRSWPHNRCECTCTGLRVAPRPLTLAKEKHEGCCSLQYFSYGLFLLLFWCQPQLALQVHDMTAIQCETCCGARGCNTLLERGERRQKARERPQTNLKPQEGNCTDGTEEGGRPRFRCSQGVLPFRQKPHRYNSAVDSLSSPEVYVTQMVGAAHPAYLITFA